MTSADLDIVSRDRRICLAGTLGGVQLGFLMDGQFDQRGQAQSVRVGLELAIQTSLQAAEGGDVAVPMAQELPCQSVFLKYVTAPPVELGEQFLLPLRIRRDIWMVAHTKRIVGTSAGHESSLRSKA